MPNDANSPLPWLSVFPHLVALQDYSLDAQERSVLTLEVLPAKGNTYTACALQVAPNVLSFDARPARRDVAYIDSIEREPACP